MTKTPSLFIIAGEPSGDFLGAQLLKALPQMQINGIGGHLMEEAGLTSLFPMEQISLMGLTEILPHIFTLKRRIQETVLEIERLQPSVIVTIDSPGFCLRVIKGLKKRGSTIPVVHYVAPSVWAWKPGRAKKLASLVDHLLVLFPFEPPYFTCHNLPTTFVGHPLIEQIKPVSMNDKDPNHLILLPGSRTSEIKRLLPIFIEALKDFPDMNITLPTLPHLRPLVESMVPKHIHVVDTPSKKISAFQKGSIALAASGTVSLELALYGVTMVIAYRVNPITAFIVKRLVKTKYACLVNILLNKPVVPELIQQDCTLENIRDTLHKILKSPQTHDLSHVYALLSTPNQSSPSTVAADVVLKYMEQSAIGS